MSSIPTILIAEDDKNLGYMLSEYLKINGFLVEVVENGLEVLRLIEKRSFDLCVLDVMMPEMDGFSVASKLKEINTEMPIIFLTARYMKVDKLKGFKLGADDYIVKPVDEEELIARIKAVLKRSLYQRTVELEETSFRIGAYAFDYKNQLLVIGDKKKTLTVMEADILKIFAEHKNNIVTRSFVLKKLWGINDYFNRKSMDVFVYKLRKMLSEDPSVSIKNIHGKGFKLIINKAVDN